MLRVFGPLVLCFLFATNTLAQPVDPLLLAAASRAKNLEFPTKPSRLWFFSTPEMALYKPDGSGPFPALVLHHQCGGLGSGQDRWHNLSMLEWAKRAVARGYVALVIDSLGPRGVKTVCMRAEGGVGFPRGVRDALQAAEHLRRFDFVVRDRIAIAGFSWGAMIAALASGQRWGTALSSGSRFAAAVSFYPGCFPLLEDGRAYDVVSSDIDRPLLVLMGGRDNETPPGECVPMLEAAKRMGAPVEWHVYQEATHCWDCVSLEGHSKVDFRGNRVVYRYDQGITADSVRRMFEFLESVMPARP